MIKKLGLKSFFCVFVSVLIMGSSVSVISGFQTHNTKFCDAGSFDKLCSESTEATVICSTYGLVDKDCEKSATLSKTDAEELLSLIELYAIAISGDPCSDTAQMMQDDILSFAMDHGLLSEMIFDRISRLPKPRNRLLPKLGLLQKSKASEWYCNYAAGGVGSSSPVIILPRLIPILLTPIPRLYYRWDCYDGFASCGGLRSKQGFMALGEQTGSALGFWGVGFSIFLPPIMAFGIIGYAVYCSVEADHIEYWPPDLEPEVNAVFPMDGAMNIPISTDSVSFYIDDPENELMSYTVTTNPNVGSGNGNLKEDGTYSIPISGLEGSQNYSWTVQVSDGANVVEKTFCFTTEMVAPIVSQPAPCDKQRYVSVDLDQISFYLNDLQGDLMTYTVETVPDIGSGGGTNVDNGFYTIDVDNLSYMMEYRWFVNVTDGTHWKHQLFRFQTEPVMIFDPFTEGWMYRKNITIDHSQIAGDLENFPLLLSFTDDDLKNKAQSDGDDIVFMDNVGVAHRLFHEIEYYDGGSGELVVWVNVSSLSSTADTTVVMYYGNALAANQENSEQTWDDHYVMVQHLQETTGIHFDSTMNNNDGTPHGEINQNGQGFIAGSDDFDGQNDYIDFGSLPGFIGDTSLTVQCWVNLHKTGNYHRRIVGGTNYQNGQFELRVDRSGCGGEVFWRCYTNTGDVLVKSKVPPLQTWMNLVGTYDGSQLVLYHDMIPYAEPLTGMMSSLPTALVSGYQTNSYAAQLDGVVDEIRISDIVRSHNWLLTEYLNHQNPGSFYSIGGEEISP